MHGMNGHIYDEFDVTPGSPRAFVFDEALIERAHAMRTRMITWGAIVPVEERHRRPVLTLDDAGRAAARRHILEGEKFSPLNLPTFAEVA